MSIEVMALNGVVVFKTTGDHFTGMNSREAHEHVQKVLEAIDSAQGFEEAMAGKITTPVNCPRCKARGIKPSHVCGARKRKVNR
jgi:predicted Zn-ribbon and HTH transcriptional regulator